MASFKARHIDYTGTITVYLPAEEAFELFTPEGERAWVPGWKPRYFYRAPEDGPDTSFLTKHGGEETLWMVLAADEEELSAGYARITPGSRMGTVMVEVEPIDDTSSWVTVSYELTALTPAGNTVLKKFDKQAFKAMLSDWEQRLEYIR